MCLNFISDLPGHCDILGIVPLRRRQMRNIGVLHRHIRSRHLVVCRATSGPLPALAAQYVSDVRLLGVLQTDEEHPALANHGLLGQ